MITFLRRPLVAYYYINKVMKGLRIIKKSRHLYRSVQSQSRQIITNIFANGIESDKLELNLKDWSSQHAIPMSFEPKTNVNTEQPLNNLLKLLQHLANEFYIDICSFIFLDKDTFYIVFKDKYVTIKKIKPQKSKLKYWLSHIYFSRLRNKLAESLLQQNFNTDREVIHYNEEKEYMPSLVSGGKMPSSTLIRQIKISRSSIDRKHGQHEKKQFCVGYYKNGAQQLFNYSQVLSFVQYPFNLSQISYFKILTKQKEKTNLIITFYSNKQKSIEQQAMMSKLKRLMKKEQRWRLLKDEFQEMKNKYVKSQQYQPYSRLIMLEIICFLEVRIFVEVKELKLQWTINTDGNIVLSNVSIYKFIEMNKTSQVTDGLVTLYQKCQTNRYKSKPSQDDEAHMQIFKKIKSQQKYVSSTPNKLPLLHPYHKSKSRQQIPFKVLKIKNKANSCVLRLGLNKFP